MSHAAADHPELAAAFVADAERTHWHDEALWFVRAKRDEAARSVPEWEQLRELAAAIKAHTMSRLADYLEQFERKADALGRHGPLGPRRGRAQRDRARHPAAEHGVDAASSRASRCSPRSATSIRSSSGTASRWSTPTWASGSCSSAGEPPSHIVLPAIHIKKEEVGELFHEHAGHRGRRHRSALSGRGRAARICARSSWRPRPASPASISPIAETGGFVVCTNEGNADLGVSLPKLHIACMGIEKLIPRASDLGVFLRLLARSATGQPITTYSSHFHGPRPAASCTSCWSTTAAATSWAATSSAVRSTASAAAPA